jgi:hypothetical protein
MGFIFTLIRGFALENTIYLSHGFYGHKTNQFIDTCDTTFAQMRHAASTYLTVGSCILMLRENSCSDFHKAKDMLRVYEIFETPNFR